MDNVAEVAGVTKPTVYTHFGSKEGLFEALMLDTLSGLVETPLPTAESPSEVRSLLVEHATSQIDMLLAEPVLGLLRTASAEAMKRPEWAQGIVNSLGGTELELWLDKVDRQCLLTIDSPADAADTFWATAKGALFYPVVIGIAPPAKPAERRRVIVRAVDNFLKAYASPNEYPPQPNGP